MLRSAAPRAIFGSVTRSPRASSRQTFVNTLFRAQRSSSLTTLCGKRQRAATKPISTAFIRYQTTSPPFDKADTKHEEKVSHEKLPTTPQTVSATSSVHPVLGEVATAEEGPDTDMMQGIRSDMVCAPSSLLDLNISMNLIR